MLYAALFGGVLVIFAILAAMRQMADPGVTAGLAHILRYAGLAQLIVIGIVILRIRSRLPAFGGGDDVDGWWAMSGRTVVLTWVLSEGTATLAGVIWFLHGRSGDACRCRRRVGVAVSVAPGGLDRTGELIPPPAPVRGLLG